MTELPIRKPKRRIMTQFKLTEISSVDVPAQSGARAVLLKRMRDIPAKEEQDMQKLIRSIRDPGCAGVIHVYKTVDDADEPPTFDDAVAAIRKRDRCSGTAALSTARDEHPALFKRWQDEGAAQGTAHVQSLQKGATKPDAVQQFDKRVTDVALRFGISRTTAMQRVADEDPELLHEYRSA